MKLRMAVLLAVALAILLAGLAMPRGREIILDLAFGWIGFLNRVAGRVHLRGDGVAMFAAALLAFFGILHGFLKWLATSSQSEQDAPRRPWRLRWTAAIVLLVVVMFWAGISMIGVTNQAAWLATDEKPMYGTALRRSYAESSSADNLRWMAVGIHNYHDKYRGFPSARGRAQSGPRHSWVTRSLPYLFYQSEIDLTREWNDPANAKYFRALLPELINPDFRTAPVVDAEGFCLNHYAGNRHVLGGETAISRDDFENGTSTTLLVGEVNNQFVPWGYPDNCRDPSQGINGDPAGFGGPADRRGALFVMADGSVRLIEENVDPRILRGLSTPGADTPSVPDE